MKLKHITIAAALVASAPAFAAIAPGTILGIGNGTGDSEMFLVVYDASAQVSYTLDLGVFGSSFRSLADNNEAGYTRTWTFGNFTAPAGTPASLDPTYFAQFQSQTTIANWQWSVQNLDSVGTAAPNGKSLTTTLTNGTDVSTMTNAQLTSVQPNYDNYIGNTNSLGSHAPFNDYTVNGANISDKANPVTYWNGPQAPTNSPAGSANTIFTNNAFGATTGYTYITRSSTSNLSTQLVISKQYGNSAGFGTFTLAAGATDGSYSLVYNLAPAVPEPQTYALMLAGIGCIALLARRRRAD